MKGSACIVVWGWVVLGMILWGSAGVVSGAEFYGSAGGRKGVVPWREVSCNREGACTVQVVGRSRQYTELVLKITAGGGARRGEYRYSTDGGATWSEVLVITGAERRVYDTVTGAFTGLSFRFTGEEYREGDLYSLLTWIEYEQETVSRNGEGELLVYSREPFLGDGLRVVVKITETGGCGSGRFCYSMDGGVLWSDEVLIPDGAFLLGDSGVRLFFYDGAGDFLVGDVFEARIRGIRPERDLFVVLGVVCGIAGGSIVAFGYFLSRRRDRREFEVRRII